MNEMEEKKPEKNKKTETKILIAVSVMWQILAFVLIFLKYSMCIQNNDWWFLLPLSFFLYAAPVPAIYKFADMSVTGKRLIIGIVSILALILAAATTIGMGNCGYPNIDF